MRKLFTTVLLAGVFFAPAVSVSAQESEESVELKGEFIYFPQPDDAFLNGISDNGKWACGYTFDNQDGKSYETKASIYDLENNGDRTFLQVEEGAQSCAVKVSNDGTLVVGSRNNRAVFWINNEPVILPMPEGWANASSMATCFAIVKRNATRTDTIIGGYALRTDDSGTPLKWINRKLVEFKIPEKNRLDIDVSLAKILDISPDGKKYLTVLDWNLAYGKQIMYPASTTLIIEEDANGDTTVTYLDYKKEIPGYIPALSNIDISAGAAFSSGAKYVWGTMHLTVEPKEDEEFTAEYLRPFIYDVEKDELKVVETERMVGAIGSGLDTLGNMYISENEAFGVSAPMRKPWIIKKNTGDLDPFTRLELAVAEYDGIDYDELMGVTEDIFNKENTLGLGLSNILGVSADGRVIIGCGGTGTRKLWMLRLSHNVVEYGTVVKNRPVVENNNLSAFYTNGAINMNEKVETVEVYNISGSLVLREEANSDIVPVNLNQGIYIVRMINKNKVTTSKIVVK